MADQKISQKPASSTPVSVSPLWIVRFYGYPSKVEDFRGRTLKGILASDNAYLHHNDDYLHLLFPTGYGAPVVDREVALAFRSRPAVRGNLRKAFERMMGLYGYRHLQDSAGKLTLQRLPGYPERQHPARDWLSKSSKHHARIGRILLSLRLLGLEEEAMAFHATLCRKETAMVVNQVHFSNWALCIEVDLARWIGSMETTKDESGCDPQDKSDKLKTSPKDGKTDQSSTDLEKIVKALCETTEEKAKRLDTRSPSQERKDYASALPSWDIELVPSKLDIRPVFGPSVIPSPLAPGRMDAYWSTLPKLIPRCFPKLVATLWYMVYEEYRSGNAQIRDLAAQLDHQGRDALICYFKISQNKPASKAHPTIPNIGPHFETVSLPDTIHPPAITPLIDFFKLVGHKSLDGELNIQLQILESNASGCLDSFIINPSYAYFRVNGVSVPPSTLAGPLPHFAIIEADNAVVFWWRDREACDYVPALFSKSSRKRSHEESEDHGEAAEESLSPKKRQKLNDEFRKLTGKYVATPPPDTWAGRLHHGLLRHRAAQRRRPNAISLRRSEELLDEAVVNGIAAFWIPLARSGKIFGFGRTDLFTHCRTREGQENFQMTACGVGSESFIMPLYFNAMDMAEIAEKVGKAGKEKAEKEKAQHYNLRPRSKSKSPPAGKGTKATSPSDPGKKNDPEAKGKGKKTTSPADSAKKHNPKAKGKGAKSYRSADESSSSSASEESNPPPSSSKSQAHPPKKKGKPLHQNPKAKTPSKPVSKPPPSFPPADHTAAQAQNPATQGPKSPSPTLQASQGIPTGHHLLAIATRSSPLSDPPHITLTIYDSAPGHIPTPTIHAAARGLVTHTGWLGILPSGEPNRALVPIFTPPPSHPRVPLQSGANSCGLYTILNAWAWMLGIRVRAGRRGGCGAAGAFEELGREVVDLAMGGGMDGGTVRAFLWVFGYAEGGVGVGWRDGGEGVDEGEGVGEGGDVRERGNGMDEVEAVRLEGTRDGEGGTLERELARVGEEDLLAEVVRESLRDG